MEGGGATESNNNKEEGDEVMGEGRERVVEDKECDERLDGGKCQQLQPPTVHSSQTSSSLIGVRSAHKIFTTSTVPKEAIWKGKDEDGRGDNEKGDGEKVGEGEGNDGDEEEDGEFIRTPLGGILKVEDIFTQPPPPKPSNPSTTPLPTTLVSAAGSDAIKYYQVNVFKSQCLLICNIFFVLDLCLRQIVIKNDY